MSFTFYLVSTHHSPVTNVWCCMLPGRNNGNFDLFPSIFALAPLKILAEIPELRQNVWNSGIVVMFLSVLDPRRTGTQNQKCHPIKS